MLLWCTTTANMYAMMLYTFDVADNGCSHLYAESGCVPREGENEEILWTSSQGAFPSGGKPV